jgi:hypothetical protein
LFEGRFVTRNGEFSLRLDDTFFHTRRFWRQGADFAPAIVCLATMTANPHRYWELVTDGGAASHLVCEGFLYVPLLRTYYAPAAWLLADAFLLVEQCVHTNETYALCVALCDALEAGNIPWAAGLPKPEDAQALASLLAALRACEVPGDVPAFLAAFDALVKEAVSGRLRRLREAAPWEDDQVLLPYGGRGTPEELYYASLPEDGGDEREDLF